jgi:hypothetical protein
MTTKSVVLFGTLVGGVVGPGGETTGFVIDVGSLDVDASGVVGASAFAGKACVVAGDFEERTFPLRGRVRILRAREVAASASGLSRNGLHSTVLLSGILDVDVLRPGGEGPGAELTNVAPEVDVKGLSYAALVGKQVSAAGVFELVRYVTRGLQPVFKVSELATLTATPAFSVRAASPEAATVQAQGVSARFSLEEAILDAVRRLPTATVPVDWLTQVHVDSIDAEFGGIAGVSLLTVTISAALPKAIAASFDPGERGPRDPHPGRG